MSDEVARLKRKIERIKRAQEEAEALLEKKSQFWSQKLHLTGGKTQISCFGCCHPH